MSTNYLVDTLCGIARDAEATRRRLIAAARAEFAQHGIAGGRVDRIAVNARANKAQIYHYFGSKNRLFDAVWEALVNEIVEAAPSDVHDLPGFAARLSETYAEHPDLIRLITWRQLERGMEPHEYALQSTRTYVDAIATAQADGLIPDRFEPGVLFALIIHIAALWGMSSDEALALVEVDQPTQRREVVRSAVAALLT
jgi:AcrR family transcriptional regulator